MRDRRLKAYRHFEQRPMPTWGGNLGEIDFQDIYYYVTATDKAVQSWDDVPDYIKRTYDRLGIPEAEKKYLAGVGGQYDSEVVYHNIQADLERQGVIFLGTDQALQEHEEIVREYFGTVIPANDNKLAALNTAVWSGGSFIYVPPGVHVELPLQAYFRINTENMGQFERTLIIADEGSSVHYVEGCTAPSYTTASLHSAVVEIIVKKTRDVRYTTIQNWSHNVYNLVTKRAVAHEDAVMEWVDGNLGSHLTMKYPSIYLVGERAHGEVLSIAFAGSGQHQDAGGKVIHAAPNTTSLITSKSISHGTGRTSYRGLIKVYPGSRKSKSTVRCDALILADEARSDTYPYMEIDEDDVTIGHEASVSKVGSEQLFYLMSRGLTEAEASAMIVNGFIEPIVKELPMEYAVEMNRLIQLQMEARSARPMTSGTQAPRRSVPLDPDDRCPGGAVGRPGRARLAPATLRGAVERYVATPWPTGQEEEWRRTSLKDLPVAALDETVTTEVSARTPDRHRRGRRLRHAGRRGPTTIPTSSVRTVPDAGAADHDAFWQGRCPRRLDDGHVPLRARHGRTSTSSCAPVTAAGDGASFPRHAGRRRGGSSVTLLEEFSSPDGGPGWFGGVVDLEVERGRARSGTRPAAARRRGVARSASSGWWSARTPT